MIAVEARIVEAQQGTPAWHAHRARSLNASELAVAMGLSPYKSRAAFVRERATGIVEELDQATQRRFDDGHRFEAIARTWAEEILGEELYPVVLAADIEGLPLSASLDGQTMDGDTIWEHKSGGASLLASLEAGVIPEHYHPQLEVCLMLANARRCLFMASSGDREAMRYAWYEPRPDLRAQIIPAWRQFLADVAAFDDKPAPAEAVAKPIQGLPALVISVEGRVTSSNLGAFREAADYFLANIKTELQDDQDFANAEQTVKFCKDGEDRLELVKKQALAQTASIDDLFRTIDHIAEQMRAKRLTLEKLVKARKDAIRFEIVAEAQAALDAHIVNLNARLGANWVQRVVGSFGEAIKGKKTVTSVRDAASTALANAKIEASALADRLEINRRELKRDGRDWMPLFADFAVVGTKPTEDFAAIVAQRIAQYQQAEAERAQREAEQKRAAELADAARVAALIAKAQEDQRGQVPETETSGGAGAESPAAPTSTPPVPTHDDGERISLGDIKTRLGFMVTEAFLLSIGVSPCGHDKRSVLYRSNQWPAICDALIGHVRRVRGE